MSIQSGSPTHPAPPILPLERTALFLDFDGTLVEIASRPGGVVVPKQLPGLLERLCSALGGALAVVSGRTLGELDRLLESVRVAVAGTHGGEIREAGSDAIRQIGTPLPDALRAQFLELADRLRARWPGVLAEDKGQALTLHYRLAPEAEPAIRAGLDGLAIEQPWQILTGHSVYEIKSRDVNKGGAVRRMMQAPTFTGRVPVFVGDDRTDLDGIAAAVDLGGAGIAVGGLEAPAAKWVLDDPAAVRAWLGGLLRAA